MAPGSVVAMTFMLPLELVDPGAELTQRSLELVSLPAHTPGDCPHEALDLLNLGSQVINHLRGVEDLTDALGPGAGVGLLVHSETLAGARRRSSVWARSASRALPPARSYQGVIAKSTGGRLR